MQPKIKLNKTLLASALIAGLGNAFTASAAEYTIAAGAIGDVDIQRNATLSTGTSINFGDSIKSNPTAASECEIILASDAFESELGVNLDGSNDGNDNADPVGTPQGGGVSTGDLYGTGCLTAGKTGTYLVLDAYANGAANVDVTINDVTGTGWTWTPGRSSCVTDFTRTAAVDACDNFASSSSVSVQTAVDATAGGEFAVGATILDNTIADKVRIMLGGKLVFDGTAVTAPSGEQIVVSVNYGS